MRLLGDKVFIRFTKENRESIFSKEIIRGDGSKVKLFIAVDVDEIDERKSRLFVQTGIVEVAAPSVKNILVGDIVIVDYMLCNDDSKLVWKEPNGDTVYWANANTTYHDHDEIVNANRRTKHDTVVAKNGDIDVFSSIYGIIRGDKIIARAPFVFLAHESNTIQKVSAAGILYTETQKSFEREVIACDEASTIKYGFKSGDNVMVLDSDIFALKLDGKGIDCILDMDIMGRKKVLAV